MSENLYTRQENRLHRLDRLLPRMHKLLSSEYVSRNPDIATPDQVLRTLIEALEARKYAESYRGFTVGACARVNRADNSLLIRHGANYKNSPGKASIDKHAEQVMLENLQAGDNLTVMAIVGWPQQDDGSGCIPFTLHPCAARCLPLISGSECTAPNTLIMTATPNAREVEWGSIEDYTAYHDRREHYLQHASFAVPPSILKPPIQSEGGIHLDDTNEVDTREWDSKVTLPLAERTHSLLLKAVKDV